MKKCFLILTMFLSAISWTLAQRTITGTVTDGQTKEPLVGASVLLKGTTVGKITDIDGKYSLEVPADATTLVYSYVGYQNQEIALGAANVIDVTLSEGSALQEVIVTALGTKRESKALGYAAQQVDGDKLKDANTTNVVDALNGKVAGVQITSSAGTAGASSRIVLRGQTSLDGNNQALFVVDGLRIDNSELGTDAQSIGTPGTAGVAQSNRAIDINPSDIESVTVLKGAAASALYGIDGARGVILITTKKGNKKGKGLSIEYNTTVTQSEINKTVPLQNKFGLGSAGAPLPFTSTSPLVWGPRLDTMFYDGVATEFDANGTLVGKSNPLAKLDRPAKVYDPYDVFQKGLTVQHNISLTGGDAEKTSFRLAIGNLSEQGIIPKNTFNRTNITLGTTSNLLDNKLHFRSSIQYVKSDSRRIIQGNSSSGLLLGLLRTPPTFDNSNGSSDPLNDRNAYYFKNGQQRTFRNGVGFDNPYWVINQTPYTDQVNRFLGNVDITYDLFKGLSLNAKVGTDLYQDNRLQKYEINSRAVPAGRLFDDRFTSRNLDAYLTALGTVELTKDLNMTYTVGGNMYASYLSNVTVQGDGLDNTAFVDFNNTRSKVVTPTTRNQKNLSLLGSIDFGYKSFLYLGLTGRNDWVSNLIVPSKAFNAGDIGFFYPSANVSFVFSEIAKIKQLNYGKLRFSIGQVGGGAPNPYLTSTPYTVPVIADAWTGGIAFPFKSQYGLSLSDVKGATDLKPSKTTDIEVGLEAKLFKSRVSLDLSLYQRASNDQILAVPISAATGSAFKVLNTGSLSTKGMDVVLGLNPIRLDNGFRWDMNFNFTTWNTKIESLAEGVKTQFVGGFNILMSIQNIVGSEYGQLYGGAFMRTNSGNKFDPTLPYNPKGQLVIDDNAASANYGRPRVHPGNVNVGNPNPDYILGITNSFTFKGVSLSALFDIRQGGEMWNGTRGTLQNFGMAASTENRGTSTVFEGVKASDGTPNTISTKLDQSWYTGLGSGFGAVQSQFIESTAFMRLRTLNLSYRFEPTWIKKAKLSDLTLGVIGRNLWLKTDYTGVDPETSLLGARNAQGVDFYNMPNTKSWAVSLGVKF